MTTNNHDPLAPVAPASNVPANISKINTPLGQLDAAIGNLTALTTTAKTSAVVALNEIDAQANTSTTAIGTLASLTTTAKSNLVGAVNEVDAAANELDLYIKKSGLMYAPAGRVFWNPATKVLASTTNGCRVFYGQDTKYLTFTDVLSIDFGAFNAPSNWAYAYVDGVDQTTLQTKTNANIIVESHNALTSNLTDKDILIIAVYGQDAAGNEFIYSPFVDNRLQVDYLNQKFITPEGWMMYDPVGCSWDATAETLTIGSDSRVFFGQAGASKRATFSGGISIDFSTVVTGTSKWAYAYVVADLTALTDFTAADVVIGSQVSLVNAMTDNVVILGIYGINADGTKVFRSGFIDSLMQTEYGTTGFKPAWTNLYPHLTAKLPRLRNRLLANANDVTITLWGDSIFARDQHTSVDGIDVTTSPPMLTAKNIAWHMFNRALPYRRATYRRYDYPAFFTLTGTWTPVSSDANWDDGTSRPAWTDFSVSTNAAIAFTVAGDADKTGFALVYRTDTAGDAAATIAVTGGDGKVETWNGAAWVEANAATFSMLEVDEGALNGNTIYQKRQLFRKTAGSVGAAVTVTIGKAAADADRLLFWGVEMYDKDKPYLRLINAARGGQAISQLNDYIEDDVYGFTPDLVIFELPLINEIIDDPDPARILEAVQDAIYGDRGGAANTWALRKHAETGGNGLWDNFEVVVVIPPHIRADFNADGSWAALSSGYTTREIYDRVKNYVIGRGDVGVIDLSSAQLRAIDADYAYSNYYDALTGSSTAGRTWTNDSVHPNNRAVRELARHLCPVFDFNT